MLTGLLNLCKTIRTTWSLTIYMRLFPTSQLQRFLEVHRELHLLHYRVLILIGNIDHFKATIVRFCQSQLLVAVAISWHVRRLHQRKHSHVTEVD